MTIQYSAAVRNAQLDQVETQAGAAAVLRLRTGAQPANCAAARSGTIVSTITLPSDWMAAASGGSKVKSGTWEDTVADNSGTVAHFEIMDSGLTTCHMQGSVTLTAGGGDMTLDAVVVTAGQDIIINTFTINAGNA